LLWRSKSPFIDAGRPIDLAPIKSERCSESFNAALPAVKKPTCYCARSTAGHAPSTHACAAHPTRGPDQYRQLSARSDPRNDDGPGPNPVTPGPGPELFGHNRVYETIVIEIMMIRRAKRLRRTRAAVRQRCRGPQFSPRKPKTLLRRWILLLLLFSRVYV